MHGDAGEIMSDLLETIEDGVAVLTLNRPERRNAMSPEMMNGLAEALPRLAADPAVGAIVVFVLFLLASKK